MDYTLALLAHGDARTFRRTVESFSERVTPEPERVVMFADAMLGPTRNGCVALCHAHFPHAVLQVGSTHPDRQAGFCGATDRLWRLTLESGYDSEYVFWLEADFVFLRPLSLKPLAALLKSRPDLAQVSLIRDAYSVAEARAGGLVASRPGEFVPQETAEGRWMEQRSYFTTNPALMSRSFMAANPWPEPDGLPGCEGRYGIALRERGFSFAAWGHGEEWVAHMGIRDAIGTGY